MRINIIAFLLCIFSAFIVKPSAELEQQIMKTDIDGVKQSLLTVKLDVTVKAHLVELVNDITQTRLRMFEIFSYCDISHDNLGNIKETLSQKTLEAINKKEIIATIWALLTIGSGIALHIALDDNSIKQLSLCIRGVLFIVSAIMFYLTESDIKKKIYSNLQQNYQDSILIKQLIMNAAVQV